MANELVTLAEFLTSVPTFKTLGAKSVATLSFAGVPSAGVTFRVTNNSVLPFVTELYTAVAGSPGANQFQIGVDEDATAVNFATALAASGLVDAVVVDTALVQVVSKLTGPGSEYALSVSDAVNLVLSDTKLKGGSDVVSFFLDAAAGRISPQYYGSRTSHAHVYLTAHYCASYAVATGSAGSGGGGVKRQKIDKVEIEYAITASSNAELGSTKWGQLFLDLTKTLPTVGVVGRQYLVSSPFRRQW